MDFLGKLIIPRPINDLPAAQRQCAAIVFQESSAPLAAAQAIDQLAAAGVQLNGLHNNGYTLGHAALYKGDVEPIAALERGGYNFALDTAALVLAEKLWSGMLHRTVALAAQKFDPTIAVPSEAAAAAAEACEMQRPSLRGSNLFVRQQSPGL